MQAIGLDRSGATFGDREVFVAAIDQKIAGASSGRSLAMVSSTGAPALTIMMMRRGRSSAATNSSGEWAPKTLPDLPSALPALACRSCLLCPSSGCRPRWKSPSRRCSAPGFRHHRESDDSYGLGTGWLRSVVAALLRAHAAYSPSIPSVSRPLAYRKAPPSAAEIGGVRRQEAAR